MSIVLLTQADAVKAIDTLAADAKSVQERIHVIACSTLDHARAHGDYTGCLRLLNALPNGQRVKALNTWFTHFSNKKLKFKFDKDSKTWVGEIAKERKDEDFKVAEAMETSFADLTNEVAPRTMTLEGLLKWLERQSNNSDTNADGTPKVSDDARIAAARLVASGRELMIKMAQQTAPAAG